MIAPLAPGTAVSLAILKLLPNPFVWISLSWFIILATTVLLERTRHLRLFWLYAVAVVLAFGCAEAWSWRREGAGTVRRQSPSVISDDVLGWRMPSGTMEATEYRGERTIYDVRYSIDSSGWRVTSHHRTGEGRECVLFFVDSFTFGEGVNDDEALPSLVSRQVDERFRVFSLSAPGYGAEHMLATIESGKVEALRCRPAHAIYQAQVHHVFRAAGMGNSWRAPRYELDEHGAPRSKGPGRALPVVGLLERQLGKSHLYRALAPARWPSSSDVKRYLAIVRRSKTLLEERYPGMRFSILVWGTTSLSRANPALYDEFYRGILKIVPDAPLAEDILPGYRSHPLQFQLDAADPHPSAAANRALARYIVDSLLVPLPPKGARAAK
jgi:hypothetical protein